MSDVEDSQNPPPKGVTFEAPSSASFLRSTPDLSHRNKALRKFLVRSKSRSVTVRSRRKFDVETGRAGVGVECTIQDVTTDQLAQDPKKRLRKHAMAAFCATKLLNELEPERHDQEATKQYRLATRRTRSFCARLKNVSGAEDGEEDLYKNSFSFASLMVRYLNWTFRTGFLAILFHFALIFLALTIIWTIIIFAVSELRPECLQLGDLNATEVVHNQIMNAYALSWTTFSTVGYGVVYPQIGPEAAKVDTRCAGINALMAFEAFSGILFTAMCAAIIFGKIIRVQSYANVDFSVPIVIKYGGGVAAVNCDDDDDDDVEQDSMDPFPIMEFRIMNRLHATSGGGEIVNARVKCVASIAEGEASDAVLIAAGCNTKTTAKMKSSEMKRQMQSVLASPKVIAKAGMIGLNFVKDKLAKSIHLGGSVTTTSKDLEKAATVPEDEVTGVLDSSNSGHNRKKDQKNVIQEGVFLATGDRRHTVIDEGSSLVPRQIMSPLELETDSHPTLKRVWILRHELNEKSPLLKGRARKMIADNGGKWPTELNTYEQIRESIHFHEIVVLFNGTSNATGTTGFKQHIYHFANVNIGYTFASVLHLNSEGVLSVDERLLNDVLEQRGGGGEPFGVIEGNMTTQAVETAMNAADTTFQTLEGAAEQVKDVTGTTFKAMGGLAEKVKDDVKTVTQRTREGMVKITPNTFSGQEKGHEDESDDAGEPAEPKKTE